MGGHFVGKKTAALPRQLDTRARSGFGSARFPVSDSSVRPFPSSVRPVPQGETEIRHRAFYILTSVLGLSLFIALLVHVGFPEIVRNLRTFGWAIVVFILLEGVATVFYAWATRLCFSPSSRTLSLWTLWKITMSERAISYVTFSAGMGGDVVKWSILERHCPSSEAVSVVMIYRLAYFLSKLLFCLVWAIPILMVIPLSAKLKVPLFVGTALLGGGLIGFFLFQRRGLFAASLEGTVGRFLGPDAREWVRKHALSFDAQLKNYHREHSRDFWAANFILWLGFMIGGVLQTWVFSLVVLRESSPFVPLIVWILGSWADMVFFFVPAGLGTKEFARVLIFESLSFSSAAGISFALVLRSEEIFWTAVGLLVYVLMLPRGRGNR